MAYTVMNGPYKGAKIKSYKQSGSLLQLTFENGGISDWLRCRLQEEKSPKIRVSSRKWWPELYEWVSKNPGIKLSAVKGNTYDVLKEKYPDLPIFNSINSVNGLWGMREAGLIEHKAGENQGWYITGLRSAAVDFLLKEGSESTFYKALSENAKVLLKTNSAFGVKEPKGSALREHVLELFKESADGMTGSIRIENGEVSHICDRGLYNTFGLKQDNSLGNVTLERDAVNGQRQRGNITTVLDSNGFLVYVVDVSTALPDISTLNTRRLKLPSTLPTDKGMQIDALPVYASHVRLREELMRIRKDVLASQ